MATESFALHNLGSDTLPVIRDTHCCHATMVNLKGPFASVTRQEWHTECQTSPGHHGENTTFEQRRKNISPIFCLTRRCSFGLQRAKKGTTSMGTMHGHSTRAPAPGLRKTLTTYYGVAEYRIWPLPFP